MAEGKYQTQLIKRLKALFPGCEVLKNDPSYQQGIPDLTVFFDDRWAMLEVKAAANAPNQPNQEWFVERMDSMSFARFIYPENEEEVLSELQRSFRPKRKARSAQS